MPTYDNLNPSPHFNDSKFEMLPDQPPRYDNAQTGLGRYYVVEDPYQPLAQQGLLWTDDEDTLGFAPANNAAGPLVFALPQLLLKLRAAGESASDAFALIVGMTPGDLFADADLAEIPAILNTLNTDKAPNR